MHEVTEMECAKVKAFSDRMYFLNRGIAVVDPLARKLGFSDALNTVIRTAKNVVATSSIHIAYTQS